MPKVYCADLTCEFCNDKGVCTQKVIRLSFHSICTLWDGRQEFHRCKSYQKSKHYIEMQKLIAEAMAKEKKNE